MSSPTPKALLLDAYYQVLDNVFFRVLAVIVVLIVLLSFLVAFSDQGIELFFGWSTITYAELFASVGADVEGIPPSRIKGEFIKGLQQVFVRQGAGLFGVILCIAATAFFVPRMLEKGSADIVFSKPLSRLGLLVSRYLAGVLFVALLATLLIGGLYLSIWICSGYNDPGFLWSIPTLIYLFALIHSVSTLIAVLSRSTVSSILVAILFFPINGCIHTSWVGNEFEADARKVKELKEQGEWEQRADGDEPPPEVEEPPEHWFLAGWSRLGTVLHYVLPKTGDADHIAAMFMRALEDPPEVLDEEGRLTIEGPPGDYVRQNAGPRVDLDAEPVVWIARDDAGEEVSRVVLTRRSRMEQDPRRDRLRRRSMLRLSRDLEERIEAEGVDRDAIIEGQTGVDWTVASTFLWTDVEGRERRVAMFPYDEWLFEVAVTSDPGYGTAGARTTTLDLFLAGVKIAPNTRNVSKDQWYAKRFGWTAPLKYNAFFSVASSLAFVAAMLALAWWRLSRIDF